MKKIWSTVLIIMMFVMLTACGEKYEDTNGADDYSLQTITDDDIIHLSTGASGLTYSEQNLGGMHSSEYSSKNFNGVEQIYLTSFILPSDVYVYIGHMAVESGNFKLAVINNDEIIQEIPLDSFNEEILFEDLTGDFSVHVAGENAAFEFYIDVY